MSTQIAETILAQLGGMRFLAMTGAKSLAGGKFPNGEGLSFKLPRSRAMIITLNGNDLYDVKFMKNGSFRADNWIEPKTLAEESDVYVEDLVKTFESMTGLYTTF